MTILLVSDMSIETITHGTALVSTSPCIIASLNMDSAQKPYISTINGFGERCDATAPSMRIHSKAS